MNPQHRHRHRTRELVRKYSSCGTESLIAYVAETNGMLDACKVLLQSVAAEGASDGEWLQRECADAGVHSDDFLKEVEHIVTLFLPGRVVDDHYSVLGLSAGATPEAVKRAYRALSLRYHPDTASPSDRNKSEKFIAINSAYRALLHEDSLRGKEEQKQEWRKKRERKASPEQRRQLFIWLLGLVLMLVVVSSIASLNLKKRAMLAGLQETRGAFIPPVARKASATSKEEEKAKEVQQSSPGGALTGQVSHETVTQAGDGNPPAAHVESQPVQPLPKVEVSGETAAPRIPSAQPMFESQNGRQLSQNDGTGVPAGETRLEKGTEAPVPPREESGGKTIADTSVKEQKAREVKAEKAGDRTGDTGSDRKPDKEVAQPAVTSHQAPRAAATEQKIKKGSSEAVARPAAESPAAPALVAKSEQTEERVEKPAAQAAVPAALPPPLTEEDKKIDESTLLQAKVERFFQEYIAAYEERNLLHFSRFFLDTSEENGKPVNSVLPVYMDLFASTRRLSFQIMERTTSLLNSGIAVDGKFKVVIEYSDGGKVAGSGPIYFLLTEGKEGLLIKDMRYQFHEE